MVSYTTRDEFIVFGDALGTKEQQASLRKTAANRSPSGATFLSHSSKDGDLVAGAIRILENHGATVYIDKKDPTLPPYTNKDTAWTLKKRIRESGKFVLLASNNSKESKWVPWELGIADENKGLDRVALFPAVESRTQTSWTKWEYMGLYDRIVWGRIKGYKKDMWIVLDDEKFSATPLADWLRK